MREMLRKLPFALSGMLLISTVNAQDVNDVANQTTSSLTASLNTAKFQAKPIQKVNKEGVMAYSLMLNYSSMEAALYQSALSENFRLYPISEGINAADLTIKAASFIANDKLYRLSEVYDPAEYDYTLSWKVFDISDEEDLTITDLFTWVQRRWEYAFVDPITAVVYGISQMMSVAPFFG